MRRLDGPRRRRLPRSHGQKPSARLRLLQPAAIRDSPAPAWLERVGGQSLRRCPTFRQLQRSHYVAVLTWRAQYRCGTAERSDAHQLALVPAWMALRRPAQEIRHSARAGREAARLLSRMQRAAGAIAARLAAPGRRGSRRHLLPRQRYLRRIGGDHTRRVHGLDVMIRAAALARDDGRAASAIVELRDLARRINTRIALGTLSEAEATDPATTTAAAITRFEDAIDEYELAGAPYESAAARLRLAALLAASGQPARAAKERDSAKAVAARIGAAGLLHRAAAIAPRATDAPSMRGGSSLSTRVLEVLGLVAQGLSNKDIGARLFVSPFTVKRHVANILTKLDLPSRAAAASYAARHGLT